MTTSRDTVMDKIRAALADDAPPIPIPRDYIRRGQHDPGSSPVIELLVDRLVDYRALVHQVTAYGLTAALDAALSGTTTVVIGTGLDPVIAQACTGRGRTVTPDSAPHVLSPQELDAIDAVVTTARVAIAMSGTIILDGGAGQGRRAITLVPDRHNHLLPAVARTQPHRSAGQCDHLMLATVVDHPVSRAQHRRLPQRHRPAATRVTTVS
jgi:L-lactate dehydrogenase complex protein LldG